MAAVLEHSSNILFIPEAHTIQKKVVQSNSNIESACFLSQNYLNEHFLFCNSVAF